LKRGIGGWVHNKKKVGGLGAKIQEKKNSWHQNSQSKRKSQKEHYLQGGEKWGGQGEGGQGEL